MKGEYHEQMLMPWWAWVLWGLFLVVSMSVCGGVG